MPPLCTIDSPSSLPSSPLPLLLLLPFAIALPPSTSPEVVADVVSFLPSYCHLPPRRRRLHRGCTRISTSPRSPRRHLRHRSNAYLYLLPLKISI
ncbi:hypothetical protein R3P38DRAFT_499183 [Favolaschia claudopus]|uniref:Uncharacterized protein n=1 Tax=Favolaschia claudopus TaxID=2862362 RepID=A0AAV9ZE71_9AGAR